MVLLVNVYFEDRPTSVVAKLWAWQVQELFSLRHSFQTGSWAHPASCPMDTGDSFPRGKAAGT
jgi:hypothetical protein